MGKELAFIQQRVEIIHEYLLRVELGAFRTNQEPAPEPVVEAENQPDLAALQRRTEIADPSYLEEPAEPVAVPETVVPETITETLPEPPLPMARPPAIPMARPPQKALASEFKLPALNLEQFMGVKLFAWLGGLALFFGIAFFVKYSFEHNLIPPGARVAIGFIVGAGVLVGGIMLHRQEKYRVLAQTLCASGTLILYGVTVAAHSFYSLFGGNPGGNLIAFGLMALITATAFLLAVRLNALVVAILGILGGFLAPILFGLGQDNPLGLFGYIALLDIGLLMVARVRRWFFLTSLGAACTILMQIVWFGKFFNRGHYFEGAATWTPIAIGAAFMVIFLMAAFRTKQDESGDRHPGAAAMALCGSALLFTFFFLNYTQITDRTWLLYGFVFFINAGVLAGIIIQPKLGLAQIIVGLATFAHLAIWTTAKLRPELLGSALAVYFIFGVLHSLFPVVWQRLKPGHAVALQGAFSLWFPVMSAALPFLLLIMATLRLPVLNPTPVFGLGLALVLLLLGLAKIARITPLSLTALLCMLALEAAWHSERFQPEHPWTPLCWYLGVFAIFALYPFIFRNAFRQTVLPWATAALAAIGHFLLVFVTVKSSFPGMANMLGLIPAFFVVPAILSLLGIIRGVKPEGAAHNAQLAWFGGTVLLFITLIFPIQFDHQWLTLSWALEGAALIWLFLRVPHQSLRVTGLVLLVVAFAMLTLNPSVLSYHPRGATPIFNWYLYTYGIAAAAMFLGARWLKEPNHKLGEINARGVLWACGGVLLFWLLNIEIADYFTPAESRFTSIEFSGNNLGRDMAYSIAWGLFALTLLIVGFWVNARGVRYAGIGLLVVSLLKVFFHDLSSLDSIYRIAALIGVAIIALAASFLYQRYFDRTETK